jgi:hypothetical protein
MTTMPQTRTHRDIAVQVQRLLAAVRALAQAALLSAKR